MLNGFLNLDKPLGLTSHDAVAAVRRLAGQRRVGHGGTLDPLASGVLPIALGHATRLLEYLVEEGRKIYRAEMLLGRTTTTDDAEGAVLLERPLPPLSAAELSAALEPFTGLIWQSPPRFSAIQVEGRRMYDVARKLSPEELLLMPLPAAREVYVEHLALLDWQPPLATVEIVCGKGTYIRSIARDLGEALGCGAHLAALRRTAVGPLTERTATPLQELRDQPELLAERLLPLEAAVADWPRLDADEATVVRLLNGQLVDGPDFGGASRCRAHTPSGDLLALLVRSEQRWRPVKVFAGASATSEEQS